MRKVFLLSPLTAISIVGIFTAFHVELEPELLLPLLVCLLAVMMSAAWIVASEI